MKIAVVGGGAAGCFCAIELKKRLSDASVDVFEAGKKPLAKLALTGGGRCNLTNSFEGIGRLQEAYPRGANLMKKAFYTFDNNDCIRWYENEGVRLVTQPDGCVFPVSQDAMQIVRTLENLMRRTGVAVHCESRITDVRQLLEDYDAVVVTTGGGALRLLEGLPLEIAPPVPSLFTFRIEDKSLTSLTGTVVPDVTVSLAGTRFSASGPLLITDWGVSGPAVLKLSSYGARFLSENGYKATLSIRWTEDFIPGSGQRQVSSDTPEGLSSRLWHHLIRKSGVREDIKWSETGGRAINKLSEILRNDCYSISGRGQYKEEFVTCGGVSLEAINPSTMEARAVPGLFFAGEVLDIDAITGGFNLQAAWTTGYMAAKGVAEKFKG